MLDIAGQSTQLEPESWSARIARRFAVGLVGDKWWPTAVTRGDHTAAGGQVPEGYVSRLSFRYREMRVSCFAHSNACRNMTLRILARRHRGVSKFMRGSVIFPRGRMGRIGPADGDRRTASWHPAPMVGLSNAHNDIRAQPSLPRLPPWPPSPCSLPPRPPALSRHRVASPVFPRSRSRYPVDSAAFRGFCGSFRPSPRLRSHRCRWAASSAQPTPARCRRPRRSGRVGRSTRPLPLAATRTA